MKEGRNLETIVGELLRQAETKRDFLTPAKHLHFDCNGTCPALHVDLPGGSEAFPLLETGHAQLAERLEIPKAYYDRMREEAPWLLEENVRTWLDKSDKQWVPPRNGQNCTLRVAVSEEMTHGSPADPCPFGDLPLAYPLPG